MQPFWPLAGGLGVTASDSQVYESVKDDLIGYATALVGPDLAPDVVSTVVLRVLAKRQLIELENPRAYLFRAVLNEARKVGSRRTRKVTTGRSDVVIDSPNLHPEVLTAVSELPVRQRAATFLVYWVGCTVHEVADLMGVGEGTVKRYLSLARTSLKEVLHASA